MVMASLRRRVGVYAAREFARHRLRRIPLVGVPRGALDARRAAMAAQAGTRFFQGRQLTALDFFAVQAQGARAMGG